MKDLGAANASMSGSGPSVFGYFISRGGALNAWRVLRKRKDIRDVILTNVYNP
jgi:shikimate kinase